eukprot:347776-Chlamydomonas_euryale.AAC.1
MHHLAERALRPVVGSRAAVRLSGGRGLGLAACGLLWRNVPLNAHLRRGRYKRCMQRTRTGQGPRRASALWLPGFANYN